MTKNKTSLVPTKYVENKIIVMRTQKVIIDSDLSELYGVATGRLNEQVKRNIERFPEDFMFQLTKEEFSELKSHFATSSSNWGGRRKLPYVFTEHGAIMAASVLNTPKAIEMSVYVVRAFVRFRQILASHLELGRKIQKIELKIGKHDGDIKALAEVIAQLISAPQKDQNKKFGFHGKKKK